MDPALNIASPFHNEAKALGGTHDAAMDTLAHMGTMTSTSRDDDWPAPVNTRAVAAAAAAEEEAAAAAEAAARHGSTTAAAGGKELPPTPSAHGRVAADGDTSHMTLCSACHRRGTAATVPSGGVYVCGSCVAQQRASGQQVQLPQGTFRCCPTATTVEVADRSDAVKAMTAVDEGDTARASAADRGAAATATTATAATTTTTVLCCAGCHGWYHASCVGMHDAALCSYAALSSTRWYCPAPSCCEAALAAQLRRR